MDYSPAEAINRVLTSVHSRTGICLICRDAFTRPVRTPCDHFYRDICIRTHLSRQDHCPLCQRTLFKPRVRLEEEQLQMLLRAFCLFF